MNGHKDHGCIITKKEVKQLLGLICFLTIHLVFQGKLFIDTCVPKVKGHKLTLKQTDGKGSCIEIEEK